ncbi:MAG: HPP family protein [Maioricimonas sp. JB049]
MDNQQTSGRTPSVRIFCRDADGTSSVEYAIMLVVVLAIPIAVVKLFGVATGDSLGDVLAPRSAQHQVQSIRATPRPVFSETEPPALANPRLWLAVEGFIILILGTALTYGVWQRNRRDRIPAEMEPDDDELVEVTRDSLNREAIFAKRKHIHRIFSINMPAVCSGKIEVRHIMSTRLTTIGPDATAEDVATRLEQDQLRHLLVVDGNGRLIGIVSDRDALRNPGKSARDMMTARPFTVEPSTRLKPAATSLIQRRISCLPVVENGELCGVLTGTDLILALQCTMYILESLGQEVARGYSTAPQQQPTTTAPSRTPAPAAASALPASTASTVPTCNPAPAGSPQSLQPTA